MTPRRLAAHPTGRTRILALAVLVAAAFVSSTPAEAAGPILRQDPSRTWSVQPASGGGAGTRPAFTYDLAPGGTITDAIRVANFGEADLTLAIYSTDAYNTATGDFDVLAGDVEPAGVGTWATLPMSQVTVPARDSVDVPFTLAVPHDAEPGDHAGGIVTAISDDAVDEDGNRLRVDHRVGTRIYVRVDGPLRPALTVEDTTLSYSGSLVRVGRGAASLTYTVRNAGNVRLAAHQEVSLRGPLGLGGQEIDLDDLPELLPGSRVSITVPITDVWPTMRLSAVVSLDPDGADPVVATTSAWALPSVVIPLVLIGLGAGLFARHRRRVRTAETA